MLLTYSARPNQCQLLWLRGGENHPSRRERKERPGLRYCTALEWAERQAQPPSHRGQAAGSAPRAALPLPRVGLVLSISPGVRRQPVQLSFDPSVGRGPRTISAHLGAGSGRGPTQSTKAESGGGVGPTEKVLNLFNRRKVNR